MLGHQCPWSYRLKWGYSDRLLVITHIRASNKAAAVSRDVDEIYSRIEKTRSLIAAKDFVTARQTLDEAEALASRYPFLEEQLREIAKLRASGPIRFGANGYVKMEDQWLPAETARAWKEARDRDDPTIASLKAKATAAFAKRQLPEAQLACEEALAMMDTHPVKPHPEAPIVQKLLADIKNETVRDEMTARGLVLYDQRWVTPDERFRLQQLAKGLIEYRGKWMSEEEVFAAKQTEKGLVFHSGKWMTPDQKMEAQGFVQFEGAWLTPQKKSQLLAEREKEQQAAAARAEAEREARMADARRRQDEARKIEAQKPTAYAMSQMFIKRKLKSPSSAKFELFGGNDVAVVFSDGWYIVRAPIEAQNDFGVLLRKIYLCKLRLAVGDKWEAETAFLLE
jgi:hypothetical protein